MAYIIKPMEDPAFEMAIYVILSPFGQECFVGKCFADKLKEAYKQHYYLKNEKTKELFLKAKEQDILPPMYMLTQLEIPKREAFFYVVAWTKYFMEHGYLSLAGEGIEQYLHDLKDESKRIYEEIKYVPFSSVCEEGKDLFPAYGKQRLRRTENSKKQIYVSVKPKEYDLIKQKADAQYMSLSKYCKSILLSEQNNTLDPQFSDLFLSYLEDFSRRDEMIKQIMLTIYSTKKYRSVDLKILQELIDKNEQQQQEAMDRILEIIQTRND